jgi:endonuclease YncB( thermonuclease family)
VRTTILFRRSERRKRVDEAKAAAVFGVKRAGYRSAHAAAQAAKAGGRNLAKGSVWAYGASKRAGIWSAGALGRAGTKAAQAGSAAASRAASSAARAASRAAPVVARSASGLRSGLKPVFEFLSAPQIALPLVLISFVSALSAAHRIWIHGMDGQALTATLVALTALILWLGSRFAISGAPRPFRALGNAASRMGDRLVLLPGLDRLTPGAASLASLVLLVSIAAGGVWLVTRSGTLMESLPSFSRATTPQLEGRAAALSGSTLRVSGSTVVLDGVESPENEQACGRPGELWNCARAAKEALANALQGKRVVCDVTGETKSSEKIGRCLANGDDIAAKLVAGGHVFATPGIFARYVSIESEAKDAKNGVWSGAPERPADYRAKRWEEAKRAAPEGCPIKGRVASGGRIYLLPWSPSYNNVRIVGSRGERWFCSEAEAQAAGWKPVAPL